MRLRRGIDRPTATGRGAGNAGLAQREGLTADRGLKRLGSSGTRARPTSHEPTKKQQQVPNLATGRRAKQHTEARVSRSWLPLQTEPPRLLSAATFCPVEEHCASQPATRSIRQFPRSRRLACVRALARPLLWLSPIT